MTAQYENCTSSEGGDFCLIVELCNMYKAKVPHQPGSSICGIYPDVDYPALVHRLRRLQNADIRAETFDKASQDLSNPKISLLTHYQHAYALHLY
jgi:hypothetical protein